MMHSASLQLTSCLSYQDTIKEEEDAYSIFSNHAGGDGGIAVLHHDATGIFSA